ncbi:MAG: DNA/RNA nuclease SfsA [Euryarchaeota archaeon]|nr:DNA/RNA nuclease SfsA [Euryarchaeota archaeon]|tara:strand:- start:1997 stop:2704 length:708 start_codon:yes stop_codon:yes gene_type:complete
MKFQNDLEQAFLIKRYKRFLADVRLKNNEILTVHCANTGSMIGLNKFNQKVLIENSGNPNRKLLFSWKLNDLGSGSFVIIDTGMANKIVNEALNAKALPELSGYTSFRKEVKYGFNSRVDFLLENGDYKKCYVEVKSVTLSRKRAVAEFPDSITTRGAKHLIELSKMVKEGNRAVLLFLVCRNDCKFYDVASDLDPYYQKCFKEAQELGVEVICYDTVITCKNVKLGKPLKEVQN